jgi:hypothetical protein
MGSTTFGDVTPAMIGSALPATFNIGRAGIGRVSMDGRP